MLIDTKDLSEQDIKKIENFLCNMDVNFSSVNEKTIFKHQNDLRDTYLSVIEKTNLYNIKTFNLVVKSAIPQEWIGNAEEELKFNYFSRIRNKDGEYFHFDDQQIDITSDVEKPEELIDLICYIKDNFEPVFDFTFSESFDEFNFDSEQEKIIQLF